MTRKDIITILTVLASLGFLFVWALNISNRVSSLEASTDVRARVQRLEESLLPVLERYHLEELLKARGIDIDGKPIPGWVAPLSVSINNTERAIAVRPRMTPSVTPIPEVLYYAPEVPTSAPAGRHYFSTPKNVVKDLTVESRKWAASQLKVAE